MMTEALALLAGTLLGYAIHAARFARLEAEMRKMLLEHASAIARLNQAVDETKQIHEAKARLN